MLIEVEIIQIEDHASILCRILVENRLGKVPEHFFELFEREQRGIAGQESAQVEESGQSRLGPKYISQVFNTQHFLLESSDVGNVRQISGGDEVTGKETRVELREILQREKSLVTLHETEMLVLDVLQVDLLGLSVIFDAIGLFSS